MVYKLFRLNIPYKIIQDSLPPLFLKLGVVLCFRIERRFDTGLAILLGKQRGGLPPIGHGVADLLVLVNVVVYTFEIKTEATVFCFHAMLKFPSGTQVVLTAR